MGNTEFVSPPNKSNGKAINNSEITKNQKIILGCLLFILSLVLIVIGLMILPRRVSLAHNSIIVGGYRPYYAFSIDQFRKTNNAIMQKLGKEAEWSPDGQWIVFSVEEPADGSFVSYIYIMRANGSERKHIPSPQGSIRGTEPTWSPSGDQIAYAAATRIFIVNIKCLLQGEACIPEPRLLIQPTDRYWPSSPDWSPDGRQIIYGAGRDVFKINVDGQSPTVNLTSGFDTSMYRPRWSPDGAKIATKCDDGQSLNICVMDSDGINLTYLTHDTTYTTTADYPRWSPDGDKIAYIARFSEKRVRGLCALDPTNGCPYPTTVFIINVDGSGITHLPFDDNIVIDWFSWYP